MACRAITFNARVCGKPAVAKVGWRYMVGGVVEVVRWQERCADHLPKPSYRGLPPEVVMLNVLPTG